MKQSLIPIFVLTALLLLVGLLLWLHHKLTAGRRADESASEAETQPDAETQEQQPEAEPQEECCGMHITCERDSLSPAVASAEEYYDDEELDAFAGRSPQSYDDEEIEIFRDVLLTLRPEDIAPWARAIQRRGIELPMPVRDELLMIVAEARAAKTATHS